MSMSPDPTLPYTRLLVQVDTTATAQPALRRAIALAKALEATLRVVDVESAFPTHLKERTARLEAMLVAGMEERLGRAVDDARAAGVQASAEVLHGDVATALVAEAVAWRADLLLRSHGASARTVPPAGPIDHHLLRRCPCPVWLVTPLAGRGRPRVVAAVDPDPDDDVRQALARNVVATAAGLARAVRGTLHLFHAWMPYGLSLVRSHATAKDLREYVDASREAARARFDALVDAADLPRGARRHFVRGEASAALPSFVRRRRMSILVIGTVARTGLAGLVMGNTAERVLRQVRCSVVALKPEGFAKALLER